MQNSLFRLIVVSGQNIVTLCGWSKTYNSLLVCDWLMRLKHSIPLGVGVLVIDLICKFTVILSKQVLIKAISRFVFFQLWTGLMAKCCSAASHRDLVIKELWQFDKLPLYPLYFTTCLKTLCRLGCFASVLLCFDSDAGESTRKIKRIWGHLAA